MRFRPGQHLRRQSDIRAVREQGRRVDGRAFTVWWRHRAPEAAANAIPAMVSSKSGPEQSPERSAHSARPEAPATALPPLPRAAVIASIAAVGPAVRRNRAKRRLRELFRRHQSLIPPACDLLLIARAQTVQWQFPELERVFIDACRRIAPAAPALRSAPLPAPTPIPCPFPRP
jgi:ribonuclease P protein component